MPDETLSPTQPFSTGMPSYGGPPLTERDMWGLTPLDQLWCRIEFSSLRYEGPLTPLGLDRSLIYPSIGGGMNWGGGDFRRTSCRAGGAPYGGNALRDR